MLCEKAININSEHSENNMISVSYNYSTETITAENKSGFLDLLLPEKMIMYNNKVLVSNSYMNDNMLSLSLILYNKMKNDKDLYKNNIDIVKSLRAITSGYYINNINNNIINRNIL